jgi:Flp pilus assembly pilin Flp
MKSRITVVDQLKKWLRNEEGQDLVEYALLLVFLALAAIAVLPTLSSAVNNVFSQSASTLGGS